MAMAKVIQASWGYVLYTKLCMQVYTEQIEQLGDWKIPPVMEEMKSKAKEAGL